MPNLSAHLRPSNLEWVEASCKSPRQQKASLSRFKGEPASQTWAPAARVPEIHFGGPAGPPKHNFGGLLAPKTHFWGPAGPQKEIGKQAVSCCANPSKLAPWLFSKTSGSGVEASPGPWLPSERGPQLPGDLLGSQEMLEKGFGQGQAFQSALVLVTSVVSWSNLH